MIYDRSMLELIKEEMARGLEKEMSKPQTAEIEPKKVLVEVLVTINL